MKKMFKYFSLLTALSLGLASTAFAQLQWNSYSKSGTLVTPNVASGGDSTYGGSVTFTIPASTQLEFATTTFVPFNTPSAGNSAIVTFNISMSGGLTGRPFGFGLFNDPGITSQAMGYWGDFNISSAYFECFQRDWTNTTYMYYDSGNAMNSSKVDTGTPAANTTYSAQIQVNNKSGVMQLGTGTTVATAGLVIDGSGVTQQTEGTTIKSGTNVNVTTFNEFAVMFYNSTANPLTLTLSSISLVPPNPGISVQPVGYSGNPGDNTPTTAFNVTLNPNSATPLTCRWYQATATATNALVDGLDVNNSTIQGSATTNLTFLNAQVADSANYFLVITNVYGSSTSSPAALNITVQNSAPTVTSISPANATVIAGNGTNVTVVATGTPGPVYFWYDNNGNLIQSGSGYTLALSNLQLTNAGTYSVIASNYLGTASTNFTISIIVPPCISQPPSNVLVNVGDPVNFYVVEGGCGLPAPAYQWYKNGNLILGATSTNYSIASVVLTDIGNYTVIVSNSAGSVTNSAFLAINSGIIGTPLSPANNASGVCYDTPLYLSFNETPSVGNVGKIRIYNTANPATPVDTIDMSSNTVIISTLNSGQGAYLTNKIQAHSAFQGDSQAFNYFPVIITNNTAAIYPHSGVLTSNQTYYVTIDPGVIIDSYGAYWTGINNSSTWQFTTKPTGPANPTNLVVAADGSGDFVTVQGAVDTIPLNNTNYTLINIRNGTYTEIVDISAKHNVTFRGQSRTATVVGYANNNNINGTTHARMAFKVNANDIKLENLTLWNITPQGGSQAEALMIETGAKRFILNNCNVDSLQDTILANVNSSQGYFYNSTIKGNFDYVWGGGNLFFTNCTMYTVSNIYVTNNYNFNAARTDFGASNATNLWLNPAGSYTADGFSYVNCKLLADSTVTTVTLEDANGTANGLVAFINCCIDTNHYVTPVSGILSTYLLWEYSNYDATCTYPVSLGLTVLTNNDPRLLAAENATNWLYGWAPQMAPNITGQPANVTVSHGQATNFSVSATGIPDPTYQWYQNGLPIPGATGANYSIASAVRTNGGNYTVAVNNGSGSVTSVVATLTYSDTAPVTSAATYSRPAGYPLIITIAGDLSTYWSDVDSDPLALTGAISSTNGASVSYDSSYVYYTNANDVADEIDYTVGDGFGGNTPGIINILVGPPPTNSVAGVVVNGDGSVTLSFVGVANYTYQVDATTNLTPPVVWTTISTNIADLSGQWQITDLQATNYPNQFYRSVYRP